MWKPAVGFTRFLILFKNIERDIQKYLEINARKYFIFSNKERTYVHRNEKITRLNKYLSRKKKQPLENNSLVTIVRKHN